MLEEIDLLSRRKIDFGFETTLSGKSHLNLLHALQRSGYIAHLYYLWVPTAEFALSRVRARVSGGGDDVAEAVVRRRFDRSIRNFLVLYRPLADSWTLFNNAGTAPSVIAVEKESKLRIMDLELFERVTARYEER